MIELLRGTVQSWECDVMGHMNVRHYLLRAQDATRVLAFTAGIGIADRSEATPLFSVLDQHVRFNREMPAGTPFSIHGGFATPSRAAARVYLEIRNVAAGIVAATVVQDLAMPDRRSGAGTAAAESIDVEVPDYAAPRGLSFGPPEMALSRDAAVALGLPRVQLGVVRQADCDQRGETRPDSVIGWIWDGLPHVFARPFAAANAHRLGGAALEYRLIYRRAARLGDIVEVRTGLRAVAGKTNERCFYAYDHVTGEQIAAAASIGVYFDLDTRKAVAPDAATLQEMRSQVIPHLPV